MKRQLDYNLEGTRLTTSSGRSRTRLRSQSTCIGDTLVTAGMSNRVMLSVTPASLSSVRKWVVVRSRCMEPQLLRQYALRTLFERYTPPVDIGCLCLHILSQYNCAGLHCTRSNATRPLYMGVVIGCLVSTCCHNTIVQNYIVHRTVPQLELCMTKLYCHSNCATGGIHCGTVHTLRTQDSLCTGILAQRRPRARSSNFPRLNFYRR